MHESTSSRSKSEAAPKNLSGVTDNRVGSHGYQHFVTEIGNTTVNTYHDVRRRWILIIIGSFLVLAAAGVGLGIHFGFLAMQRESKTDNSSSTPQPTTIPPPSPTTSGTDALPSSSTIPLAPPTTTADGLYLVNFNSTRDPKNIGSIFAYFNHFDLTANIGQAPDASTFVANGRYANWEDNRYTEFGPFALILGFLGIFSDQVYFTSEINVSSAAAASLPVNAPCGVGANGNQTTGAFYRNFTIYKSEEILLSTDQKNGTQLYALYYAM
ncbi:MAG: hypothetical protein Q9162_006257 [Coniocarpon cinnabarinum]